MEYSRNQHPRNQDKKPNKKGGKNQHNPYKQRQLETTITRLVTADNTTTQVQFKDRK